jgi:hypothetical protein
MATKTLPQRQTEALDRATSSASFTNYPAQSATRDGARLMITPAMVTLARWLAKKAIKAELKAAGLRPERELSAAANVYFAEHRNELIDAARNHPALLRLR